MTDTPASRCLTLREVAARLRVGVDRVRSLIETGRLKAFDLGTPARHCYRVTPEALAEFEGTTAPERKAARRRPQRRAGVFFGPDGPIKRAT